MTTPVTSSSEVTAETVTNEMIHELADDKDPTKPRLSLRERAACIAALRVPRLCAGVDSVGANSSRPPDLVLADAHPKNIGSQS